MWRLVAFLAWPVTEIALFVVIGGRIGLLATLAAVFGTAALGIWMLRAEVARGAVLLRQGAGRVALREGQPVAGLFRALAGMLFILPGFLTDALALVLLAPPVQAALTAAVMRRVTVVRGAARTAEAEVIEGEWTRVPPEAGRRSGWVRGEGDAGGH